MYWVALATWFGSAAFVAVAAPIIFRVIRESDPTLPGVLSVNLDVKNPNRAADLEHLPPAALAESIAAKEKQILALMDEIKGLLGASK